MIRDKGLWCEKYFLVFRRSTWREKTAFAHVLFLGFRDRRRAVVNQFEFECYTQCGQWTVQGSITTPQNNYIHPNMTKLVVTKTLKWTLYVGFDSVGLEHFGYCFCGLVRQGFSFLYWRVLQSRIFVFRFSRYLPRSIHSFGEARVSSTSVVLDENGWLFINTTKVPYIYIYVFTDRHPDIHWPVPHDRSSLFIIKTIIINYSSRTDIEIPTE